MSIALQEAALPILKFSDCQKLGENYAKFLNNTSHLCAGDPETAAVDTCTVILEDFTM